VIVVGLAVVFHQFFMFMKHNDAVRDVIPFGNDPYDAIGSFAVVIGMLAALISVFRAFLPYGAHGATAMQRAYTLRAQLALVFCVFVTLLADGVAMIRHLPMWAAAQSRSLLLILFCAMTVLTTGVFLLVIVSQVRLKRTALAWTAPVATSIVIVVNLALYPEKLIEHTGTHLLTVLVGAVLLFAPVRQLLMAVVPLAMDEAAVADVQPRPRGKQGWAVATFTGIVLGFFFFAGEMTEAGGPTLPLYRIAFVALVFITLATAGILIAYAFLAEPLGL
jgi:hypothetical protein